METINEDLDKARALLKQNLDILLHRGEKLENLIQTADDIRGAATLFKKTAKKIEKAEENKIPISISIPKPNLKPKLPKQKTQDKPVEIKEIVKQPSHEYLSSIEDTDIREYEQQLRDYYYAGEYQYVLDKASQLGLIDSVKKLLYISEYVPMNLNLADALYSASYFGHFEVIEALLDNDIENERFFGKEPRLETESLLPIFSKQLRIPYLNNPLTHNNLRNAVLAAYTSNHYELAKILETYYYRTHSVKDRHDIRQANQLLGI